MRANLIRYAWLSAAALMMQSCTNTTKTTDKQPKREYVEEYCEVCKGTGKVKASTGYKAAIAIPTLGHSFLIGEIKCDHCGGDGLVLKPILREDTIRH